MNAADVRDAGPLGRRPGSRAEKVLVQWMVEHDALTFVAQDGLDPDLLPTEEVRPIVEWSLRYYHESGMAPSVEALKEQFGDLLSDQEIDVDDEPEDSVQWALGQLRGNHLKAEVARLAKGMVRAIRESPIETRHLTLAEHSAQLSDLSWELSSEASRRSSVRGRILDVHGLMALPGPEALIPDVLDQRSVALLYGPSGSGKSFLALDWALSIATGSPWFDRPVVQGRVLYLAGEGVAGLGPRVKAWLQHRHLTELPEGLEVLSIGFPLASRTGRRDDDKGARLRSELRDVVAEGGYSLVVVDTIARYALGLEENSNSDMAEFVDAATRLADQMSETGGSVLLIHHSGKAGTGERGASSLLAGVDMAHEVSGDKDKAALSNVRRVRRVKAKDAQTFHEFAFRLESVPLEGQKGSAVPVAAELPDAGSRESDRLGAVLDYLHAHGPTSTRALRDGAGVSSKLWREVLTLALRNGVEFVPTLRKDGERYADNRGVYQLSDAARRRREVIADARDGHQDEDPAPDRSSDQDSTCGTAPS